MQLNPFSACRQKRPLPASWTQSRSSRTLWRKTRMDDGAVAREQRRLDDFVIPGNGELLFLPIYENFQEGQKILGIEARCRRGHAARHIEMADNLDAIGVDNFPGSCQLAVAAAFYREIDDNGAGPHRSHHLL